MLAVSTLSEELYHEFSNHLPHHRRFFSTWTQVSIHFCDRSNPFRSLFALHHAVRDVFGRKSSNLDDLDGPNRSWPKSLVLGIVWAKEVWSSNFERPWFLLSYRWKKKLYLGWTEWNGNNDENMKWRVNIPWPINIQITLHRSKWSILNGLCRCECADTDFSKNCPIWIWYGLVVR